MIRMNSSVPLRTGRNTKKLNESVPISRTLLSLKRFFAGVGFEPTTSRL